MTTTTHTHTHMQETRTMDTNTTTEPTILYTWPGGHLDQSAGETASWYYRIHAEPCTVAAYGIDLGGRRCALADAYWICAQIPGVTIGGWFPGWDDERELERPRAIYIQAYAYAVREQLGAGTGRWSYAAD